MKYDWAKIKHEYITDPDATQRKLVDKYGVSIYALNTRSKKEGWYELRKKHQNEIVMKACTKTLSKQAHALSKEADFLELMKGHVGRLLEDSEQFQRQLVTNPVTGETEERITEKFDARSLKDTMQTIEMIEKMTRSLYNLQKAETIQKQQIDAERLALERERFEFEKQKAEFSRPDTSNTIRIDGMEKEWSE